MENHWILNAAREIDEILASAVKKNTGISEGIFSGVSRMDIAGIIKKHAQPDFQSECRKAEIAHFASTLYLAEKYLDEKIRGNKVIEGILKDINNGVERIADHFDFESEAKSIEEKAEAVQAANNKVPIFESDMTKEMRNELMDQIEEKYASGELPTEPGHEYDLPVHYTTNHKFALCGVMGTPSQPFAARMNEPVTVNVSEVTCQECLRIIKAIEKS